MRLKYLSTLLALLIVGAVTTFAQNESNAPEKKVVIIEKVIDQDGNETTETIRLEGAEAEEYLQGDDEEVTKEIEVRVEDSENGTTNVWISRDGDEEHIQLDGEDTFHFIDGEDTKVRVYKFGDEFEEVREDMEEFMEIEVDEDNHEKKIIIRKHGQHDDDSNLLKEFGLDNIDPDDIRTIDVRKENGESEVIIILKDGKKIKKVKSGDAPGMGNMFFLENFEDSFMRGGHPCDEDRPFLGISMMDIHPASSEEELVGKAKNGVKVTAVTSGSGAEAAGLLAGDIITAMDGKVILTNHDISEIIKGHKVGDQVDIELMRGNDTELSLSATLGKRKCHEGISKMHQRNHFNFDDRNFSRIKDGRYTRNPCKPLIGFYHTMGDGNDEISVKSVIDETPASRGNLQKGDVVLSFDGVAISSWDQLIALRDEHEAGDRFKMTILRDGKKMKFKGNFNDCPNQDEPEVYDIDLGEDIVISGKPIDFQVYPNPSQGQITVEYQGEAAPLSIQISDITGKVLIDRTIEDFDGNFKQEFDFSDAAEGTLLIRFQQGDDVIVKQVVKQSAN